MPEPIQVPEYFESEEKRSEFIESIPESPENMEALDKAMNTEVREAGGEPRPQLGEGGEPPKKPESEPAPPLPPTPEPSDEGQPPSQPSEFVIKRDDLPDGIDTPGKAFKSLRESQDLIARQQKFIQERLDGATGSEEIQQATARAEKAESELAEMKERISKLESAGGSAAPSTEQEVKVEESRLERINTLLGEISELQKQGKDALDDEFQAKQIELFQLQAGESKRLNDLSSKITSDITAFRKDFEQAHSQIQEVVTSGKQSSEQQQAQQALENDLNQIDSFASEHADDGYRLTKPAKDLDGEYKNWRYRVATLYYGRKPINLQEVNTAMQQLQARSPSLMDNCKAAGVPTEASGDMKVYLDICQLLDEADGWYKDATTGRLMRRTKYDPASRQNVPDRYPSLGAYYDHKLVSDGTFANRIQEARRAGGKAALDAAGRRDPETIQPGEGTSREQARLELSAEDAFKVVQETDEEEAMAMARRGDTSLFNKYVEACKVLVKKGQMDAAAIPTLEDIGVVQ